MKRIWQHPEVKSTGRRYWRSLGEYEGTTEFQETLGREFDPGLETESDEEAENNRRGFLKMMGGAAALAGMTLTSCRRPLQKILPFTEHVEWIIPGKPLLYATAMPRSNGSTPMVVVTHEGRPTHLQGNPLHPQGGGLDIFAQSSIVELYNPDRVKEVSHKGKKLSWGKFEKDLRGWWEKGWQPKGGEGLALLISPSSSPSRAALLAEFATTYPKAKVYSYEPVHRRAEADALKALAGENVSMVPDFTKAERVFSLDSDFLALDAGNESWVKDFMAMRSPKKVDDVMSRLYVVENRYTLTGGTADHRKPVAASLIPAVAAALAVEVGKLANDGALQQAAAPLVGQLTDTLKKWIALAAADLVEKKGRALVLAGPRYSAAVQALALGINQALGALGSTLVSYQVPSAKFAPMEELLADLNAKKVTQLFITAESDPAYDTTGFTEAVKEAKPHVVQLALRPNRTGKLADWVLPATTYLESWGDAVSATGLYSIVQPMIMPLFGGASEIDLLLAMLGRKRLNPAPRKPEAPAAGAPEAAPAAPKPPEADPAYEFVKATFTAVAKGWDEEKWNLTLRDGFLKGSAFSPATAAIQTAAAAALVAAAPKLAAPTAETVEIVLTPDASVWDGRYIDNPWVHEAPDPITKLTWDNAAWLSPKTFLRLGLKKDGDLVKVTVGEKSLTLPAIACPGHAHDSVTIPLGYGQKTTVTDIGKHRGFDAYSLRSGLNDFVLSGKLEKAEGHYKLAITQENYTMEARAQVREGTQEDYKADPDFAQTQGMDSHIPPVMTLYQGRVGKKSAENPNGFDYENEHQWGMVIDLSKCIGCSACMVACQSENNIPVVGKEQVRKGRTMHWVRMDRYFATPDEVSSDPTAEDLENPALVSQPVACQQCEAAPCETVCPVNATVHTVEGLNAMAYNRCIGTRYCANNCPYTARRFNFFDWNKRNPFIHKDLGPLKGVSNLYAGPLGDKSPQEVRQLGRNPNVSVRMRGVIEKCTYCVQRLEEAKIRQRAKAKDDPTQLRVPDSYLKVACQSSCAADAIVFGDIANPESRVAKAKLDPRNYEVLKYIGTRPRTSYLARIRNVNPKLAEFEKDRTVPTGKSTSMEISF